MSYVTGISGNVISAASAGWAPTNSAEVSAIASAYATGSEQVVTSLQYATSESATVASTVTADTAVGYGAKDISADYYDYGYGPWTEYNSSTPLIKVRMTAAGNMRNYSSYPYYLYMVPYGVTNDGNVSNTGNLTGARDYGYFSGDMNDFIVSEGTASASNPYYVDITFNVTHVPFVGSDPAWWGTDTDVPGRYVVDSDVNSKPVFCVAGGYDGYELFELRSNTTAELDFGSLVTVSAVSGINELEIAGAGGGIDSATVSAIASSYAEDVSAAASGAVSAVSSNSADWMKLSSCFAGLSGIVTSVGSSTLFTPDTASSFMGIGSAIKSTTGSGAGFFPHVKYVMGLSGYYPSVKLSAHEAQTYVQYMDDGGSISTIYVGPTARITGVSGDISAYSTDGAFTLDYTANSIEPIAFQSDLTGAGGIDSATCSAIASAYAESAVSAVSGDYYSTSNPSGFITSAPFDSATCSAIASSYAESAVSSVSGNYALSSDVSATVDLVGTQSANWGGSALALSAGPGVKLEKSGNVLVASMDETVLWSGSCLTQGAAAVSLSEAASNFEKIDIYAIPNPSNGLTYPQIFTYPGSNTAGAYLCPFMTTGLKGKFSCGLWTITNGSSFNLIAAGQTDSYPTQNWDNSYGGIVKVVGINRTAEE